MQIHTEFVKGSNLSYEFRTVDSQITYEFVTPQPFHIDFVKGNSLDVRFVRPNSTLAYEFSIGKQGPKGNDGAQGSLWFSGTTAPSNTFGNDTDMYLNYTTYDLFQKVGVQWTLIGNIRGPQGPAGDGNGVLPAGGTTGQRLAKLSNADFDATWVDVGQGTYIHTQAATATVWTINHNLNKYPSVTTVATNINPEGVEVKGDVEYLSNITLQVSFKAEINGKAYLN
jgi:hypothetical protein